MMPHIRGLWRFRCVIISCRHGSVGGAAPLPKILVEIVEHASALFESPRVVLGGMAKARDQMRDAAGFLSAEFGVLEVYVVHDLGDGRQRRIVPAQPREQYFERAAVAVVGKFGFEHIEAKFTGLGHMVLRANKSEACLRIDESADQPG
jgi:hypothetical protein